MVELQPKIYNLRQFFIQQMLLFFQCNRQVGISFSSFLIFYYLLFKIDSLPTLSQYWLLGILEIIHTNCIAARCAKNKGKIRKYKKIRKKVYILEGSGNPPNHPAKIHKTIWITKSSQKTVSQLLIIFSIFCLSKKFVCHHFFVLFVGGWFLSWSLFKIFELIIS